MGVKEHSRIDCAQLFNSRYPGDLDLLPFVETSVYEIAVIRQLAENVSVVDVPPPMRKIAASC
jgi:hypothetical protein